MKFAKDDIVRHNKSGGVYVIDMHVVLERDQTPAYAYSLIYDRRIVWVRPAVEMEDGRFTLCQPSSAKLMTATEIKAGDTSVHQSS